MKPLALFVVLAAAPPGMRRNGRRKRLFVHVGASELEVIQFAGLGNETAAVETWVYDVHQWRFTLAPACEYSPSEKVHFAAGPIVR
jgi:hypothetical protein